MKRSTGTLRVNTYQSFNLPKLMVLNLMLELIFLIHLKMNSFPNSALCQQFRREERENLFILAN